MPWLDPLSLCGTLLVVVPVAVGAALQRREAGGRGSLLPHAHGAQCPQVTRWEGTATAGTLGTERQCRASHNPGRSSTVSCEGWAGRRHNPESLREPFQCLGLRLSRNKPCLSPQDIAAHPMLSPPPQPLAPTG